MAPYRRKLIEVDLPLDDINRESAREKFIRHGHPSTLHLWWSRKPLGACRAVIFASLVDDPSSCPDQFPTETEQTAERQRLHAIIKRLVKWENSNDEKLLAEARYEIARSVAHAHGEVPPSGADAVLRYLRENVPQIYDPFCGGGSIPLEAQRLGLDSVGSDLNPVPVLITKALVELPHPFRNRNPVNPSADPLSMFTGASKRKARMPWRGTAGLASDIRYYGRWMHNKAQEQIGHLYPPAQLPDGTSATGIAWLWARTVPCPNPACRIQTPLIKSFQICQKRGNEHWTRPVVDRESNSVSFVVQDSNDGVPSTETVSRNGATCIACGASAPLAYVREQASSGNMSETMKGIVVDSDRGRMFLSPTDEHIQAALEATPTWRPTGVLPDKALGFRVQRYGVTHWHQLFSERQLTALTTFSDLLRDVRTQMTQDGAEMGYADAVCTYLSLVIGKMADNGCRFATWVSVTSSVAHAFCRQALPMVWDFAEVNPFSNSTQNWISQIESVAKVVERLHPSADSGTVYQANATTTVHASDHPIIVTDPPYYDNIGYADLSDFFYVWLRPLVRDIYPELFAGILTPKAEEIVVGPRFEKPRERFEALLGETLIRLRERCTPAFPSSIFYAYKQQESERAGRVSTGWETMLTALVEAGFQLVRTWPMRTESPSRLRALRSNALASSVVLVCRPRAENAPDATRREFFTALEQRLPASLDLLTREGHIAPVDLAQAAIGLGMEVYSSYRSVKTIAGEPVSVREALIAINRAIADYDEQQAGNLDSESRFCLDWLKLYGHTEGKYGEAETLARAKNVVIAKMNDRLLTAVGGVVKLLPLNTYRESESIPKDGMTAWEGCFRMAYHLGYEDGEDITGAVRVAQKMGGTLESVERLARILYNHYDRKGDSQNAVIFNTLVTEWQTVRQRKGNAKKIQRGKGR